MIAAVLKGPSIDYAGLSPFVALLGGAVVVLLLGLGRARAVRTVVVPLATVLALATTAGLSIWQYDERKSILSGALRIDGLALVLILLFVAAAAASVVISGRERAAAQAGHGEYHALLLSSVAGMATLVAAQNLVVLFLGLELLSIALYILCATEVRRASSLESGLKYLIIGSVGSATLLYGLALIYGATGSTDFSGIAARAGELSGNPLMLTGIALVVAGLAFKASVAPFHQWTPDVYEGAPTPITSFMAVATKAAAFGVILRFFDVALIDVQSSWGPAFAALATATVLIGNVGALGQSSVKRILAYSGVAQAGYLLIGVVVGTRLGVAATVFYLLVYTLMNVTAFSVVAQRERETGHGDHVGALAGLGASRPLLAWPMTIAMLSLAGLPATAGFVGKIYLIQAAVSGEYAWLAVVLVVGSMISLGYYLRLIAAMWMRDATDAPARRARRPAMAGGSPEADRTPDGPTGGAGSPEADDTPDGIAGSSLEGRATKSAVPADPDEDTGDRPPGRGVDTTAVAIVGGAATLILGIVPGPLFSVARHAASALQGLM